MTKFFLTLCLFFGMSALLSAQNPNILSVKVSGQVLSRSDSNRITPLSAVNIYHKRRRIGTISDGNGFFSINLLRGDTIIFSRIGYGTVTYILPGNFPEKKVDIKLVMQEKPYTLREVKIVAVPPPKIGPLKKQPKYVYVPPTSSVRTLSNAGANQPGLGIGPISLLYDAFSKRAKEKRLVAVLLEKDAKEKAYQARLNPDYVSELTGFYGSELDEFMAFCQPPTDFVLAAEEYDLVVAIVDCQKKFQNKDAYYQKK
ncbi:MAG: carboxypeptidase-like regulatory domain-containing protein [Verrucomicrobia bacterium]|nr:carboxypeptidase-like regulatory domain-containing protein [Cytophagales bacterium]